MTQSEIRVENFREGPVGSDAEAYYPAPPDAVRPNINDRQSQINTDQVINSVLDIDVDRLNENHKRALAAKLSAELARLDDQKISNISDHRIFARGYLAGVKQGESDESQPSARAPESSHKAWSSFGEAPSADVDSGENLDPAENVSEPITDISIVQPNSDSPIIKDALDDNRLKNQEFQSSEVDEISSETQEGQETSADNTDDEPEAEQMNQRADRVQSISAALSTLVLVASIGLSLGFGFGVVTLTNPVWVFAIPVLALVGVALVYIEAKAEQQLV